MPRFSEEHIKNLGKGNGGKTCRLLSERDEENVINLSFLIVWCFLSLSLHQLWRGGKLFLSINHFNREQNKFRQKFKFFTNVLRSLCDAGSRAFPQTNKKKCYSIIWVSFLYLFSLPNSHRVTVTKMNVIKCDFHQREIWYVYRFNDSSKANAKTFLSRNIEIFQSLKFLFWSNWDSCRGVSSMKNMLNI